MVRLHLGGRRNRLLELPHSDYAFLAEELTLSSVNKKREQLDSVSFGAYQILCMSGKYKGSFKKYKKDIGLVDPTSRKVDKSEKEEAMQNALSIVEILNRNNNGIKKKTI